MMILNTLRWKDIWIYLLNSPSHLVFPFVFRFCSSLAYLAQNSALIRSTFLFLFLKVTCTNIIVMLLLLLFFSFFTVITFFSFEKWMRCRTACCCLPQPTLPPHHSTLSTTILLLITIIINFNKSTSLPFPCIIFSIFLSCIYLHHTTTSCHLTLLNSLRCSPVKMLNV